MIDFLLSNIRGIASLSAVLSGSALIWRFFQRRSLEVEIHPDSSDSFGFILDDERNTSRNKLRYYAHLKVTLDVVIGKGLELESAHLVFREGDRYCSVVWPPQGAPKNVENFFGLEADGEVWKDSPGRRCLLIRGVAEWAGKAFSNLPSGGYRAFIVLIFKGFNVVVPLRLASLRDGTNSLISKKIFVIRRAGRSVDPVSIVKEADKEICDNAIFHRVRICVADLDFLPFISPLWWVQLKRS